MKIKISNPIVNLILVYALFLLLYIASKRFAELIVTNLNIDPNFKSSIFKLIMVAFSFLVFFLIPGYKLMDFGFKKPEITNYFKIGWLTFVIVIGGMIVFGFLYMGLLPKVFGVGSNGDVAFNNYSLFKLIFLIWVWSSFSEEVYMRGLFQSLLNNLKCFKFLRLNMTVWLSGLTFGLLHLSIYTPERLFFTFFTVTQAIILGIFAAYYREKSNSIYIPIMIHFLANIYGSLPLIIKLIVT